MDFDETIGTEIFTEEVADASLQGKNGLVGLRLEEIYKRSLLKAWSSLTRKSITLLLSRVSSNTLLYWTSEDSISDSGRDASSMEKGSLPSIPEIR
jgi:hypothetical protein